MCPMSAASPLAQPAEERGHGQHEHQDQQREQQHLGVRAGGDDDVLALVQQLARDGHGPIMSPGTVEREPRRPRRRPCRRRWSRRRADRPASMSMARPGQRRRRTGGRPGRRGRASTQASTYAARSPASAIRPADQAATCSLERGAGTRAAGRSGRVVPRERERGRGRDGELVGASW